MKLKHNAYQIPTDKVTDWSRRAMHAEFYKDF